MFMRSTNIKAWALASTLLAGMAYSAPAFAQDDTTVDEELRREVIMVTGTRIQAPNLTASSPVNSIGQLELTYQQTPDLERVFRDLPVTIPGDGQNVNNGSAGAQTVNLRGLGEARSLIMIDGKRMVPYNYNGLVDIGTLPASMVERIDIVTGGASAVYGSDAMAGAINFILRSDFEGVEVSGNYGQTGESDGAQYAVDLLLGSALANGKGHAVLGMNYTKREGVLLGDRDYSIVGVSTGNGSGLDGNVVPTPAECENPGAVGTTGSGSTTTMPGRLDLIGGTLQFRNDGSIGAPCSVFNFNPFNYTQTPNERFSATAIASYEINPNAEVYARSTFSATNVRQQVAPSGVFGTRMTIPLMNPFLQPSVRTAIMDNINNFRTANPAVTLTQAGVIDNNANGVFDMADSILVPVRRRTLELGTRSEEFDTNLFQFVMGVRGDIAADWTYDVSFQYAESDRVTVRDGYTNVSNIATQLNTVSATTCTTPAGVTTAGCVPMNIFGGFGSISAAAADYGRAIALQRQLYQQTVFSASATGPINAIQFPWAQNPGYFAFGVEYREELGDFQPDECLKLAPASCQGGAGGNQLPITGGFSVYEAFGEAIIPVVEGASWAESLSVELGLRVSDYDPSGQTETWKAGLSWEVVPGLRFRYMEQQAVRAPNVGELAAPITTGLDNADFDPCSNGNAAAISADLRALCISTGVLPALVGVVGDIVSGQIGIFQGTNLAALPDPETARTTTLGVVWQPNMPGNFSNATLSVDYYDINIEDYIDAFSGQEALDACYVQANAAACAGVIRIGSSLATSGAGVQTFTTNLPYRRAEGIEIGATTDYDLGKWGGLTFSINANYYLTNEFQSALTSPVVDCNGKYGVSCDPTPEFRFVQRSTWNYGKWDVTALWRYIGSMDIQEGQRAITFDAFESIDAHSYIDLSAAYQWNDNVRFQVSVDNLFEQDPPIIGSTTGTTAANNSNTFPSMYDALGRVFQIGAKLTF
jgi:iron complex outermembrane recepter protein